MVSTELLHRVRGFTLIEMAIVLVVIGLLLSGGLLGLAPVLESTKRTDTNGKMDRIEDALTLYVIQNGCLPCPTDGSLASTAANAGLSLDNIGGSYTSNCAPNGACRVINGQDVVPWLTLGLTEADIVDGWGNRMRYSTVDGLASSNTDMVRTSTGFPTGTLDVNGAAANVITTAAAYVLVSFGPDGSGASVPQTGGIPRAEKFASPNQQENADADDVFVQDEIIDLDGNTYFDDIVRWKTAPMVVFECGSGSCGNP